MRVGARRRGCQDDGTITLDEGLFNDTMKIFREKKMSFFYMIRDFGLD